MLKMLFRSLPGNNNFILLMKKNILRVSSSGHLIPGDLLMKLVNGQ